MSIKYLNHINLQGNRIEGAAIEPLGSAPSNNLQVGRVYYDTSSSTKVLKIYNGTSFESISGDITSLVAGDGILITNQDGPIPEINAAVDGSTIELSASDNSGVLRIKDGGVTFAKLAAAAVVIESEGIGSNDNDTTLPTSAAVKAYVDAQVDTHDTLAELTDTNITSPADGSMLLYDTGTSKWIDNIMSGDATLADSGALTLATVNSNVGSFGSATAIPTFTVNAKGLITAAGSVPVSTTLTVDADSGSENVSLATDDLRIVGTTNEIETLVVKSGTDVTVTVGLPNDVSINSQLTVGTASGTDAPVIKSISNSTAENILLESRETSASSAPDLVLYRNAGTPADSDTLGVLEFRGRNAMGTANTSDISYAGFYSRIYDASNQDSIMGISLNKGNGSGAYKSAAIFKLLGSNNSGTGALLINPANDLSIPTHNLDVNGTAHFSGNVTFAGDVTISGNQTTKNSEVVLIEDNIITLNSNETGTPSEDGGIEVERGTADNVKLYWDESTDRWSHQTGTGTEFKLHTEANDVALGTHTSGNYVASISAGTNISLTNAGAGEGKTHQISVTGLDNYDYWNLKVNGSSVDNISSQESLDFVNGNAITVSFANGEDIQIDHNDTSSQASVNNSGNAVIQDVTLDTYGHVTGLTSKTIEVPTDRMFSGTIGNGSAVIYNIDNSGASSPHINHGLGTDSSQFMVQLVEVSSGATVHADVIRGSSGRVTVTFATGNAPSSNGIRVLINKIG